ncbi:MAG: hypothetical protein K0R14_1441 [Burkholderiales bacterium]|jgi:hypothetical protein|nr:hypothetical protein [Burkholderiales bacterium]
MVTRNLSILLSLITTIVISPNANASDQCPWPVSQTFIRISTPQALQDISLCAPYTGRTFFVDTEIDLTGIQFKSIDMFDGTFDGGGNRIMNLTSTNGGLFNVIKGSAIVKAFYLENANVTGGTDPSKGYGAVANVMQDQASISHVGVSGTVKGQTSSYLGGIVGIMENGDLYDTASFVTLVPGINAQFNGVLVGLEKTGSKIDHSTSSGSIILTGNARSNGGIVGAQDKGAIITSSSSSTVIDNRGADTAIGNGVLAGLVGGTLSNVFANGQVKNPISNARTISGGLAGKILSTGKLINGYSVSTFSGGDPNADGGLVGLPPNSGSNANLCVNSYWNSDTGISGSALCSDGGRSQELMQEGAPTDYTYVDWEKQVPAAWIFKKGSYPTLVAP